MCKIINILCLCAIFSARLTSADSFQIHQEHPRIFVNQDTIKTLAANCKGPLADAYKEIKSNAERAVKTGQIKYIDNKWAVPTDLLACGIVYLIEKHNGNPHAAKYAEPVIKCWGNGSRISNKNNSSFGFHAIAYDWIYDALDAEQRVQFGNALGSWLTWYTNKPEITLKAGHWEYNQTWGVSHMNVMHARDAIIQKLLISLAITGAGSKHEQNAKTFLHSWNERIPRDCIPAFDAMGGSWAESHGHGSYGPIAVIPWAFAAWESATGKNWFQLGTDSSFLKEMSRWICYLTVPHSNRHAYIDDGGGSKWSAFQASAPFVAKYLNDPLAQDVTNKAFAQNAYNYGHVWQRLFTDPTVKAETPQALKLPLAYLLKGAGHVFMRSSWNDPNATWAFFGAGKHIAGHQHDDEGHFLISRQGGLVSKAGGKGIGNDSDHYWGGSLVFNILTIFDPKESFRRNNNNENDGGLKRLVYNNSQVERGHITAYEHNKHFTYAAADLTKAYRSNKAKAVSRQFIYLRRQQSNDDEYFVIFDRVQSTQADYAKHFMLHMPEEPQISGEQKEITAGHVYTHSGENLISTWLSMPNDFGDKVKVQSTGQSRLFLRTLLPEQAVITKRGGAGHKNWGHPLEPSAQYDHHNKGRDKGPVSNWRLEIAAPLNEQSYFLHVFQVCDSGTKKMDEVQLIKNGKQAIISIGKDWELTLEKSGSIGGSIKHAKSKKIQLSDSINVKEQYEHWNKVTN